MKTKFMKYSRIILVKSIVIAIIFSTTIVTGCAATHSTSVSTTEVRTDPEGASSVDGDGKFRDEHSGASRVEVTKTEQTTAHDGPHGVFGILRDIITLPFRALGAIL